MQQVYLDNAATTALKPAVLQAMLPYLQELYGNASSVYQLAQTSKRAIEAARESMASLLHADSKEIYFTASGTEADNWALKGLAIANQDKGKHIITSSIEHHAILHSAHYLESQGFEVTYLPVDEFGLVRSSDLQASMRADTILVSLMWANNEVGTIQPIAELAKITKDHGAIFHTDSVQAIGNLDVDLSIVPVDALSLSAHKFHGPKGVGALFLRSGVKIDSFLHGGSQERDLRAGTENVAGIVGMAKALELALADLPEKTKSTQALRDQLIKEAMALDPRIKLNGHPLKRLPGNVNLSFPGFAGDVLLMSLDMQGIAASSGSACSALSVEPSHVLLAMGLSRELAKSTLRFSLSEDNSQADIDHLLTVLRRLLGKDQS